MFQSTMWRSDEQQTTEKGDHSNLLSGLSPKTFLEFNDSQCFDLESLCDDFGRICDDYDKDIAWRPKSKAVEFCYKVFNEIAPESQKLRQEKIEKTWELTFRSGAGIIPRYTKAYVSTQTGSGLTYVSSGSDSFIKLTVRQAQVLATKTFLKLTSLAFTRSPSVVTMTHYARRIFKEEDVYRIAEDTGSDPLAVLLAINASCQRGCHHLAESKMHIAIISTVFGLKTFIPKTKKYIIVNSVINDYVNAEKYWSPEDYVAYVKYAPHGYPYKFTTDMMTFDDSHLEKLSQLEGHSYQTADRSALHPISERKRFVARKFIAQNQNRHVNKNQDSRMTMFIPFKNINWKKTCPKKSTNVLVI